MTIAVVNVLVTLPTRDSFVGCHGVRVERFEKPVDEDLLVGLQPDGSLQFDGEEYDPVHKMKQWLAENPPEK